MDDKVVSNQMILTNMTHIKDYDPIISLYRTHLIISILSDPWICQAKIMVVKDIEREDIEFISKILGVEASSIRKGGLSASKLGWNGRCTSYLPNRCCVYNYG